MAVSEDQYNAYQEKLAFNQRIARTLIFRKLSNVSFDQNTEMMIQACIDYCMAICSQYGSAAAFIALDFFIQQAEEEGILLANPQMAETVPTEQMTRSLQWAAQMHIRNALEVELFAQQAAKTIAKFITKAANDTIILNATEYNRFATPDKRVRFARVPTGSETCAFCIMLAGRGFVYANKHTAGMFDHYHDNCDCKVVCSFGNPSIGGYDYKKYERLYDENVKYDEFGHVDRSKTLAAIKQAIK